MNSSANFLIDRLLFRIQVREKLNLKPICSAFQSYLVDRANSRLTRCLKATRLHKSDPSFHY